MRMMAGRLAFAVTSGVTLAFLVGQAFAQAPPSPAAPQLNAAQGRPAATKVASNPQEKPIRDLLATFVKAYTDANVAAITEVFSDDALVVDTAGNEVKGKKAIGEMYGNSLQESPGLRLESELKDIRFITPDVARAEGRSRITTPNGDASEYNRYSTLVVSRGGRWHVAEIREYPLPPEDVPNSERLKELGWMVGDWVDESGENKVTSNIRWTDNKSYLIRNYHVEIQGHKATSGIMLIGWDPQTAQIKSWVFDSEGGHGEGLWTRTDDSTWVVKAQGVLRDGRPTSATQIHQTVNKDSVKTSSIDRIIGGQIAPDILDIMMIRKPPKPDAASPKPGANVAK